MSFFDKIGSSVTEAGNNLSQKAKELSEQNRLNGEISKKEARKRECFMVIGEMYYSSVKKGITVDFTDILAEIDTVSQECENLREELRSLKGTTVCPGCHMEVPGSSAFCPNCGTGLKKVQNGSVCSQCGASLEGDAKFCVQCGNRVAE